MNFRDIHLEPVPSNRRLVKRRGPDGGMSGEGGEGGGRRSGVRVNGMEIGGVKAG